MSTQSRPAYIHKHFHYHYHYDQTCPQSLKNLHTKQNLVSQQNFGINTNKSWKDYLNPEVNKIYENLFMKQQNSQNQQFRSRNQYDTKKQLRDFKIDQIKRNHLNNITLYNKANSRTSFQSLKQQIKQHQQFIKNYSNNDKLNYQYQTKSMINLNDKELTKNQTEYRPNNQNNFSRITPINSIDQLYYKKTDSRIVYGSKPTESSITPIKRQSIKTQNDLEMPQNKTLMSLMTRGSQSQLKLSINQKRGKTYKPKDSYMIHSQQKLQNGAVYSNQDQFSLCQRYNNKNQTLRNISHSLNYQNINLQQYNNKDALQQQVYDESYRNKLIKQQCQYLRDKMLTHYQAHHNEKK